MKVILNKDLSTLGEEGDVKDVARGYARNYLFPRGFALPYTPKTVKLFEARREEIEQRKVLKRQDATGIKEKLEAMELSITMPAGANGKLYGAVTSQTLADELAKNGFQIERKRIEIAGNSIKNTGKYKAIVKLYENSSAEVQVTVIGQAVKSETPAAPPRQSRRRREETSGGQDAKAKQEVPAEAEVSASGTESAVAENPQAETVSSENPSADDSTGE